MKEEKYVGSYHDTSSKLVFGPSMTKQSFKDECDINQMVERYEKNGLLPSMIAADPQYGDFSDPVSFHEAMDLVIKAEEQFNALPAQVRARFENDPEQFLAFVNDEKNGEELIKMGLATKRGGLDVKDSTGSPGKDNSIDSSKSTGGASASSSSEIK